jgi:hypothetical protein
VSDLVDYLRDKLEHADDPTPFRLNGLLLYGTDPIRQDGNFAPSDEARAEQIFHQGLRDYWLHDRIGSHPLALPRKKRWWRR